MMMIMHTESISKVFVHFIQKRFYGKPLETYSVFPGGGNIQWPWLFWKFLNSFKNQIMFVDMFAWNPALSCTSQYFIFFHSLNLWANLEALRILKFTSISKLESAKHLKDKVHLNINNNMIYIDQQKSS